MKLVYGLVAFFATMLVLISGAVALLMLFGLVNDPTGEILDGAMVLAGILTVGVGLNVAVVWHCVTPLLDRPSALMHGWRGWILLLTYPLALGAGWGLLTYFDRTEQIVVLALPILHVLVGATPALLIVYWVGTQLYRHHLTWRQGVLQLASGLFVGGGVAILLELVLGILTLILFFALYALFAPDGVLELEQLAENLQDEVWLADPNNALELFTFMPVLLTLGATVVVIAPVVEELLKPIGTAVLGYVLRPSMAQAFFWGVASGAGFGLMENLFNTMLGIDDWVVVMIVRIGATGMHCLATGLVALGWQQLWIEGRWERWLGLYALSVVLHALWNGFAVAIAGFSASGMTAGAVASSSLTIALAILAIAIFATIALIVSRLKQIPVEVTGEVVENMEPGSKKSFNTADQSQNR